MIDFNVSNVIGTGATRISQRIAASRGELLQTPILFENCQSIENAGVLLMLPALLGQGLMDYKPHYEKIEDVYYDMDTTVFIITIYFVLILILRAVMF